MEMKKSQKGSGQYLNVTVSPVESPRSGLLEDPVVVCPLDKSHSMQLSEFQCHLERCLIGDLLEKTCPKNPLHTLDESSYDEHVKNCRSVPTENESGDQPLES